MVPTTPAWLHASGAAYLLGQLLLPALLVYRVSLRNRQAYPLATMAGVAGYFVGGLIMSGILVVLVIIIAIDGL